MDKSYLEEIPLENRTFVYKINIENEIIKFLNFFSNFGENKYKNIEIEMINKGFEYI